jgi:hypothetical protein
MTARRPPRLAVALLNRFLRDNEPLAGDLLEEFQVRGSSLWLWRQVIAAAAIAAFDRSSEIRPLRLVDGQPPVLATRPSSRKVINLSASPLGSVGGLGLVALAVLVTITAPQVWWIVLGTIIAGILLGLIKIALSRRRADG